MSEFHYEIIEELGTLGEAKGGWRKELNLISWNDRAPKYDLRDWSPAHEKNGQRHHRKQRGTPCFKGLAR